jgi:hypothetical protein
MRRNTELAVGFIGMFSVLTEEEPGTVNQALVFTAR